MAKKKTVPFYRKKRFIIPAILLLLGVSVVIAFRVSPAPGAAVIKAVFDDDAHKKREAMESVLAGKIDGVEVQSNIQYAEQNSKLSKDTVLDVYRPSQIEGNLPIVIWTHGGAWLSGDKTDTVPYFKYLASKGFVVVALNYTLAPGEKYPTQIKQLNQAYGYVSENAERFRGDSKRIILAGDSAGAQLSSQAAAIISNPAYAKEMAITPSVDASQLAAVVLYCGIYNMQGLAEPHENLSKLVSWGNRITVWSYTGTRDAQDPSIYQMSAFNYATSSYPDAFISGGNGDPLTKAQSVPFVEKLQSLGVPVETKFYADNHEPVLSHENQFVLDKDGLENFDTMVTYLKTKTGSL